MLRLRLAAMCAVLEVVTDGRAGLLSACAGRFDLILIDLADNREDGFQLCRSLRLQGDATPILVVGSKGTEEDPVRALELEADDYLGKPFSMEELAVRMRAIMRRSSANGHSRSNQPQLSVHDIIMDVPARLVAVSGREVELTAKEFDLLLHFARNPGRVFTRDQLLELVWGYAHETFQHTVNAHIHRLRGKIEPDPARPIYIQTVWGVGYKFARQPQPPDHAPRSAQA